MHTPSSLEPLETRIAPAAIFVTYTDLDGDLVKITASKAGAVAPPLDASDLSFVGGGTRAPPWLALSASLPRGLLRAVQIRQSGSFRSFGFLAPLVFAMNHQNIPSPTMGASSK